MYLKNIKNTHGKYLKNPLKTIHVYSENSWNNPKNSSFSHNFWMFFKCFFNVLQIFLLCLLKVFERASWKTITKNYVKKYLKNIWKFEKTFKKTLDILLKTL